MDEDAAGGSTWVLMLFSWSWVVAGEGCLGIGDPWAGGVLGYRGPIRPGGEQGLPDVADGEADVLRHSGGVWRFPGLL